MSWGEPGVEPFSQLIDAAREWDEARAAVEAAKVRVDTAEATLRSAMVTLGSWPFLDEADRRVLIRMLYWERTEVPVAWIAEAFKIGQRAVPDVAGPFVTGKCPKCGGDRLVNTRTEMAELRSRRGEWKLVCDACRSRSRAENEATRRQEWQERQARKDLLHRMPYREYLLTAEWQELRRTMLRRARYQCQVCNRGSRELNVHHRTYERRGYEELRDLIVLCRDCHTLYHREGRLPADEDE